MSTAGADTEAHHGSPSRDDPETTRPRPTSRTCPVCSTPFRPLGRQKFCSDRCRKTAWRRRHQPTVEPAAVPAENDRRAGTVYECPECNQRLLGVQRCDDCGVFMRRVSAGGPCPHCQEPVALIDLLDPQG